MLSAVFADNEARAFLSGYGFHSADDAKALFLGERESIMPYLRSFKVPENPTTFLMWNLMRRGRFFKKLFLLGGEQPLFPCLSWRW